MNLLDFIWWDTPFLILTEHPEGLLVASLLVLVLGQVLHDVAELLQKIHYLSSYHLIST